MTLFLTKELPRYLLAMLLSTDKYLNILHLPKIRKTIMELNEEEGAKRQIKVCT